MAADKEYVELKRKLGVCVACGCQERGWRLYGVQQTRLQWNYTVL